MLLAKDLPTGDSSVQHARQGSPEEASPAPPSLLLLASELLRSFDRSLASAQADVDVLLQDNFSRFYKQPEQSGQAAAAPLAAASAPLSARAARRQTWNGAASSASSSRHDSPAKALLDQLAEQAAQSAAATHQLNQGHKARLSRTPDHPSVKASQYAVTTAIPPLFPRLTVPHTASCVPLLLSARGPNRRITSPSCPGIMQRPSPTSSPTPVPAASRGAAAVPAEAAPRPGSLHHREPSLSGLLVFPTAAAVEAPTPTAASGALPSPRRPHQQEQGSSSKSLTFSLSDLPPAASVHGPSFAPPPPPPPRSASTTQETADGAAFGAEAAPLAQLDFSKLSVSGEGEVPQQGRGQRGPSKDQHQQSSPPADTAGAGIGFAAVGGKGIGDGNTPQAASGGGGVTPRLRTQQQGGGMAAGTFPGRRPRRMSVASYLSFGGAQYGQDEQYGAEQYDDAAAAYFAGQQQPRTRAGQPYGPGQARKAAARRMSNVMYASVSRSPFGAMGPAGGQEDTFPSEYPPHPAYPGAGAWYQQPPPPPPHAGAGAAGYQAPYMTAPGMAAVPGFHGYTGYNIGDATLAAYNGAYYAPQLQQHAWQQQQQQQQQDCSQGYTINGTWYPPQQAAPPAPPTVAPPPLAVAVSPSPHPDPAPPSPASSSTTSLRAEHAFGTRGTGGTGASRGAARQAAAAAAEAAAAAASAAAAAAVSASCEGLTVPAAVLVGAGAPPPPQRRQPVSPRGSGANVPPPPPPPPAQQHAPAAAAASRQAAAGGARHDGKAARGGVVVPKLSLGGIGMGASGEVRARADDVAAGNDQY